MGLVSLLNQLPSGPFKVMYSPNEQRTIVIFVFYLLGSIYPEPIFRLRLNFFFSTVRIFLHLTTSPIRKRRLAVSSEVVKYSGGRAVELHPRQWLSCGCAARSLSLPFCCSSGRSGRSAPTLLTFRRLPLSHAPTRQSQLPRSCTVHPPV